VLIWFSYVQRTVSNSWFSFPFPQKNSPAGSVSPVSHLICTPTEPNLYIDIYFATVTSESALYRLRTLHVPDLISIFLSLGRLFKYSVQVWDPLWHFILSLYFYGEELVAVGPIPKLEGHPFSAVRDCLFNMFAATLHIWRPSPLSANWGRTMS
jgi:hypothetical protein